MDKLKESKLFEYVYGYCKDWSVKTHESPDFVCFRNNTPILGVEVTEIYHNETDARLKNLDGYRLSLLKGGDFQHKQDKKNLRVEFVKYYKKGKAEGRKIKAIIYESTNLAENVAILGNTIKMKEKKIVTYLQMCPEVDLVIDDASHLFHFDKYEDLFCSLSRLVDRPTIINSRFREIFLIIKNKQNATVRIPLKLNLFVEDILIFETLVRKLFDLNESHSPKDPFLILLCCLCQSGYKDIRIKSVDGEIGLVVGSHIYLYSKAGKVIHDCTTIPEQTPIGNLISETIGNVREMQKQVTNTLIKERAGFKCCPHLFLETENP